MATVNTLLRNRNYIERKLIEDISTPLTPIAAELGTSTHHVMRLLRTHLPVLYRSRNEYLAQKKERRTAAVIEALRAKVTPREISKTMCMSEDKVFDIAYRSGLFTINSGNRVAIDGIYKILSEYAETHNPESLPNGWDLSDAVTFLHRYAAEIIRWSNYYGQLQRKQQ